jgi:hypothetical protein
MKTRPYGWEINLLMIIKSEQIKPSVIMTPHIKALITAL